MKITDIKTAELEGHGYSTFVRIYTDEGLTGTGECIHGGDGAPQIIAGLKHHFIGQDPLQVDRLYEAMVPAPARQGSAR